MELPLKSGSFRLWTTGALVAGFALRALTSPWSIYHPDSGLYLMLARRVADFSFYLPQGGDKGLYQPLFSIMAALLGHVTGGNLEIAGCLVSILSGCATILCIGALGRQMFGEKVGVIAAWITALHPKLVHFDGLALTESLFTALLSLTALCAWKAISEKGLWRWLLAGALIGLSYLTRVAGLFELPVLLVWAYVSKRNGEKVAGPMIVAMAGCLLFAAPYMGYLKYELGSWYLTGQQKQAYYSMMYPVQNLSFDQALTASGNRTVSQAKAEQMTALGVITRRAGFLASRTCLNLKDFYTESLPRLFPPLLMMAIALGLYAVLAENKGGTKGVAFILSWWIVALPLQLITSTNYRYFVPLIPIAAIIAARGIAMVGETEGQGKKRLVGLVITVIILVSMITTIRYDSDPDAAWVDIQRRAATWIKENNSGPVVVQTREPYVAFFAGGDQVGIPAEPLPRVLEYAQRYGTNFLVVDSLLVDNYYPQLAPLLDPAKAPPNWKLKHTEKEGDRVILVYKREES